MTHAISDVTRMVLCRGCELLLWLSLISFSFADDVCRGVLYSTCQCKTDSGQLLDLSPLVNTTSLPLFSNITGSSDNALYSYKPCSPMTIPVGSTSGPCHNVAVCRVSEGKMINVGDFDHVKFMFDYASQVNYLQYTADNRTTKVYLACSTSEKELSVKGETAPNSTTYTMTLKTKYACLAKKELPKKGLSVGSILLILFFVGLLIYLVGGIVLLRCVRGARGFEQIPHYDFWIDFPALVKDGVLFISRGCKTEADRNYDQI